MGNQDLILKLLHEGKHYRDIAKELHISQKTIARAVRQTKLPGSVSVGHGHRRLVIFLLVVGAAVLAIYLIHRKRKRDSKNALGGKSIKES